MAAALGRESCHERVLAARTCTRDGGGPFRIGNQVLISVGQSSTSREFLTTSQQIDDERDREAYNPEPGWKQVFLPS
jgi:hypothetical protein